VGRADVYVRGSFSPPFGSVVLTLLRAADPAKLGPRYKGVKRRVVAPKSRRPDGSTFTHGSTSPLDLPLGALNEAEGLAILSLSKDRPGRQSTERLRYLA